MALTHKTSTEILADLVGFDTTSHKSNMDLMHYIQDYLNEYGVTSTLISSDDGEKANLHACIGPIDVPGCVLSGHSDVVPVDGQDWQSDPFTLTEKNDALYGRGTCDMKGFIAVSLSKVPDMVNANLKQPFHLAFSYDEEVGCTGVASLIDFLDQQLDVKPEMCIVGEPTMMHPINAHKGGHHLNCRVTGHECHSSMAPSGVNALEYAANIVSFVTNIKKRIADNGPYNMDFNPPYTTINTGIFNSGTAMNIVPNHAEFEFEIRPIPEQNSDEIVDEIREYAFKILEPRMKAVDPKSGFAFTEPVKIPAFLNDEDSDLVKLALNITGENTAKKVSFATEAGLFQNIGIPTVVCGPGSIEQAHRPDEFVKIDQMIKCGHFIDNLIARYCHE